MKQKIQKHNHDAPEKLDLFRDTFRGKMPLTDDYVFHAVFGRDTAESKGALMEILNIILARKQDPIRAIVIKKSNRDPGTGNGKRHGYGHQSGNRRRRTIKHRNAGKLLQLLSEPRAVLWRQTGEFFVAGRRKI